MNIGISDYTSNRDELNDANSYAPITNLLSRLSDLVKDDDMTKSLLGVSLKQRVIDHSLFTPGEPLNKIVNDLCSTIIIALGPVLQNALRDVPIPGWAQGIVNGATGYDAYLAGRITGVMPDPSSLEGNGWFKQRWPEIAALGQKAALDWGYMDRNKR